MKLSAGEIVAVAIILPIVTMLAVWAARSLGQWFVAALTHTFAETVRDVMAKDMAKMGLRLGESIDELRQSNTVDHRRVQNRLAQVQNELGEQIAAVEARLEVLEKRIPLIDRRRYIHLPGEEDK